MRKRSARMQKLTLTLSGVRCQEKDSRNNNQEKGPKEKDSTIKKQQSRNNNQKKGPKEKDSRERTQETTIKKQQSRNNNQDSRFKIQQ